MKTQLPEDMYAAGLNETDGSLIMKRFPVPVPKKGEVLVKIAAAPVNPSDMARIRHLPQADRGNFIAGVEGSGTVVGHGKGLLPAMWMGKRVACSSAYASSGTWAEYMVTPAMSCIPLPKGISDEQGSMLLVNPMTAVAFFKIIRKFRHKAVVNTAAASALGRIIEFLAQKENIPLINIVRNENQLKTLEQRGAQYILNSTSPDFETRLKELSIKLKATLALDAIGGSITRVLIEALPYGSTVMVYGNLSGENPETDHRSMITDHKILKGFYLVNWLKEQGLLTTLRSILKARKVIGNNVTIPVQARFPLSQVQQATGLYFSNMSAGKVLLTP